MPTSKKKPQLTSTSQKQGRVASDGVETVGNEEPSLAVDRTEGHVVANQEAATPVRKSKGKAVEEASDGQSTLDKHLRPVWKSDEELDMVLKKFSERLDRLASREYMESKFKEIVTEHFLSVKLKELEEEIRAQVKVQVDQVNKRVGELVDRVVAVEYAADTLRSKVADMKTLVERLESHNREVLKDNKEMRQLLQDREARLKRQGEDLNALEQYTRRNSVRMYGVDDRDPKESPVETSKKVASLLSSDLRVGVSTADIDVAHRLGRFRVDGNRPIICKFVSSLKRDKVMRSRRSLM